MQMPSKLDHLLQFLWRNPVFGDSYPPIVKAEKTHAQIEKIYLNFQTVFRTALKEGLPEASLDELKEIENQIGPKSIAFCVAISAGELMDEERLCNAAVAIAILYWADQSMDRGDEAMVAAVQRVAAEVRGNATSSDYIPLLVGIRREGLRHIERMARKLNEHPEDMPYILRAIYVDILDNEARIRNLSRDYFVTGFSPAFWEEYADEVGYKMTIDSGLMSALTLIYSIYRYHDKSLPSLKEIYENEVIMKLVREGFDGAIRVFDDWGDRRIDSGKYPQWGVFNINLFNQPGTRLLERFTHYSGIADTALQGSLISAFSHATEEDWLYIARTYAFLLRRNLSALPQSIQEKYSVFLNLCKRTLEAGFINAVGDIFLTEGREDEHVTMDSLNSMINALQDTDTGRL